jgi:hypothetical protein
VLIAMGILTVGLLGVAAIFPVAGFYMQRGEVADRSSAIAQAAFNEVVSRGMLDPESWRVMVPGSANEPNLDFNADRVGIPPTLNRGTFTRPFAAAFREAQAQSLSMQALSQNFGGGFVVDPMGADAFAAANTTVGNVNFNIIAMPFPSSFYRWFPNGVPTSSSPYPSWVPWAGGRNSPLRRVTFRDPADPTKDWQLGEQLADRMFRSSDDLALDVPQVADQPSRQNLALFDLDSDGQADDPLARQSVGNYSWLATVLPSTTEAFLALAYGGAGHAYEVSVAVFYKRVLPSSLPTGTDMPIVAANERMARARVVSTGLSGGELRLERHSNDLPDQIPESPFQHMKVGQWIIVCGPHPQSSDSRPLFVARWYRVLSIEKSGNLLDAGADQCLVTLRGPQWPWSPATNASGALDLTANSVSNSLCVAIIPGVVAVHSKTIQLGDHSSWSIQ